MISLLLCLCMVFSLLPTVVLADGEDPDISAGPGQVMQQNPENPGDQSDSGDLKNSENSDDLNDSENQDDLNDPENPDDSDAPQPLGEGLGSELSGNCGATEADHVTWKLTDDDGDGSYTLTISGNGAMKDYTSQAGETVADPTGWYALKDSISEIKIEEGVTGLGNWAFSYLTNVVKANIPASITSLGDHIFRGDTALTTVEWASGFNAPVITDTDSKDNNYSGKYVPTSMFDGCTSLGSGEELSTWLPDSFTGVGCAAFRGTQFAVDFGDWSNLTYIGAYGFAGMPNLDSFTLSNGIMLGLRGEASNAFNSSGLKSLTVADGIAAIPSGLCNGCEQLSSVALADFVTTIAMYAFRNTEALKEIDLKNVQTINGYAFQGSGLTALVLPESVKKVESHAFEACTSLTKVTINAAGLTLDNNNTFAGCSALSTVVTSADSKINGLNTGAFGPYKTDYAQAPVENIEINGTVDTLNFSTLASLKSLKINGKNTWYGNILPSGFENLVINGDNWNISGYQFAGKTPIKHLVVSAAEVSDNEGKTEAAFRSNPNLETAQFTGKTVKLHAKMFMGCTSLNWLDLSAVDTLTVGSGCFGDDFSDSYGASKENPNKFNEDCVIYAKDAAAAQTLRSNLGKKGIVLIVNGGTVDVTAATAGFGAVSWEGFTAKWYEEGGTTVTGEPETGKTYYVQWTKGRTTGSCGATGNEDNVSWTLAYNGDGYTLSITGMGAMADYTCNITGSGATQPWRESETGVEPTEITRVVVGDGVTNIGEFACDGLSQVKEYNIAASVAKIGAWGVCGQNAEAYKLHDSTHYVVTKDGVLMSANGKTLVSYPGGKDAVDEYVIPENVETILAGAFVGIDAKKVVIPSSVTSFPSFSFGGSTVKEIEFNANVKTLEGGAFSGLSQLKSLVFGGTTLTTIEGQACSNLSGLTEITFPDSLTTIGAQAFKVLSSDGAAAPNLKKVTFGKGMSTIDDGVFLCQSALEVIDMTHCENLTAVGMFSSYGYGGRDEPPYKNTPIVYTKNAADAALVQQNNRNLIYAVTNGGTFPADTVFETGKLAKPKKDGCLFLDWYADPACSGEKVTTFEAGQTYYAKWMDHIPEPTDADFTDGLVTVKCLSPVACHDNKYGLTAAAKKYTKEQLSATEYSVTYDADAFAVNGHSRYSSADKLNWTLTYDGSKWNLKPQHPGVDDVVLVTHAPTTLNEVTKFIDGQTDVIHTSCVNGETATCAYGLTAAFAKKDHVVSVEQEKDESGQPIRGSYIATLKVDQFAEAGAKACNDKSFKDSPRTHDVRSKNPVKWRFKLTQAEVGTDTGAEKPYVWSAEPVEADKDDVCQVAHRVVLTFSYNQYGVMVDDTKVEYKYNTTEITNNVEVPTPTREGYTFVRWLDADGKAFDRTANVTEDHTYNNIEWKPIKYRVIFDANAGGKNVTGMMEDQVFTYDQPQSLNPNQFVCTDSVFDDRLKQDTQLYEFGGWNTAADGSGTAYADEADFTNQSVEDGEQITLYAQWKHVTKTLTYVSAQGTAPDAADVDIFTEVTVAGAPANVEGYTFVGWRSDIDGLRKIFEPGDKFVMPNTNVTLTAQWQPVEQTYTVTFNTDGADQQVQTLTDVPENTFITLPDMLTKDGYAFKGWNDGTTTYAAGSTYKVTGDVTFTAQFVEIPVPETFAVTFDTNGAAESVSSLTEILGGTCITLPVGLTKADCTFDGWTLQDSNDDKVYAAGSTYQVNGNVTFVAKFTEIPAPTTYTVTFNTSGADQTVQERTVVENTEITLPGGLTKANSVFKGWKIGEADTVYAAGSTYVVKENTYFTAVFETAVTYTVAFNANGADQTVSNMSNVAAGSYITLPGGLTKQNATFLGWKNGDTLYAAGSPYQVNSNLEFTAEFKAAETFTVTYKDGDWTSETPESYKAGEWVTVKNPASAIGYTFGGWESNTGETYQPGKQFKMPDTNVVLTAKWVANTYTITWMGADGELMQTTVQHGETPVYSGATPTKDATVDKTYTFKGWDPEITAATEDTTYTAQFEEAARTYKITWKDEGGAILKTEQVAYNETPNFDGTPTKDGDAQYSYTFKDWTPTIAPVTGDAEYCATYTKTVNKYTVKWVIDGTTETQTYEYGKMPAHADPVKPATDDTVYTFKGWTPALSIVTGNVTYTAQFDEITKHTVSYDLDGGTPAIAPAKYAAGDVVPTPATVPTKTGYVFTGWLVSFENKTVNANGSFTMPNTDVTLTAQWRVAITGSVYILAKNPGHGVHEEPYSAQLTAKKDNAYGDPVAAGDVQFVLVDANGHADTSRNIGHGLTLNADGSITGTANGAGEVTFRVKLANAAGDFVSDAFEFTIVIDKATRNCTVTMEDWTYGEAAKTPAVTLSKTEDPESITYFYKVKDADDSTYTTEVPVNAGDYTVKAVVGESANYKSCEDTDDFTIHKALIKSVDPVVTAPVACEAAQSTIANGDGYTGTITWAPADATFQYSTVYAATVVLTPDSNHKFDNTTTAENGWTLKLNENGTLTLTKVFPETAQDTVKTPVIRPNGGRFYGSETITITCPTDGADIYYTLDGTNPTTGSKLYTGAFKIKESTTVKAIAVKANYIDSAVATAEFTKRTGGTGGGGGGTVVTPVKPSKKDDSLRFNTEDHFAFVNGYPDGTVKPNGNVTRAEVAAILYRVMDADCVKTYETTRCSFSDVVRGDWFNLYVATLENAGVIVDTRTNGKFRPNEAITRAELAAMLAQFADIKSAANSFNDVSARHWASDEIAVCAKMGWINGYPDGSFRPDATITRAEMMAMINRALNRTPKSVSDLLSGMKTWSDNANVNAWYYLDVQEATNSHTYTKSGTHETWKKLR